MVFTTDSGRKYEFTAREFRDDIESEDWYWLVTMLRIRQRYDPSIIRYEGVGNLEKVIADGNWSKEEIQLLYQLLGKG